MSVIKSLATKDSLWTGITAGVNAFKELIQVTKKKLSRTIKFCLEKKERKCKPNIAVEYTR